MGLFSALNKEVAIDLGTANSIVMYNDQVVFDEPSIVAYETDTKKVIAIGNRAQLMEGKTPPGVETVRPLREGSCCPPQTSVGQYCRRR